MELHNNLVVNLFNMQKVIPNECVEYTKNGGTKSD